MAIEVTTNELVNLGLASRMEVLELVHSLELYHVQAVWEHAIRFALKQMLALISSDVRNGGEHIGAVGGGSLDAVPVINTALACFVIHVKILKVVVKVDGACAEVATEEGCVGGKHGDNIYVSLATERNGETGLPFVEVGNDSGR